MAKKKVAPLPAVQIALFCDRDRRTMAWTEVPDRQRRKVVEALAQLLCESVDGVDGEEDRDE
jgi:hypothetical protein